MRILNVLVSLQKLDNNHHFEYDVEGKTYYARSAIVNDVSSPQKSAIWFIDYINNGFNEYQFVDNSESNSETILDKQTQTLNQNKL